LDHPGVADQQVQAWMSLVGGLVKATWIASRPAAPGCEELIPGSTEKHTTVPTAVRSLASHPPASKR
jgi:hypothetical protein